ncbi:hypothetical protein HUG17_3031 [Dermatophagoides farinae]|uniref:Uncharacterized protein n=1 Tax=Dermatophagoides farinae TaxID=6954 RepID=A0A9D4NVB7_DERFA|nr:hypothetical protein HUG17_3031 [Dermatophagoides farinae]
MKIIIKQFSFGLLLSFQSSMLFVNTLQQNRNYDDISVDQIIIPYKTIYGIPNKCKKISEYRTIEQNYQSCQLNSLKKWQITVDQYYTETLNFCCFVYDVLNCEIKVLSICDSEYSNQNERETRRLFDKSCKPIIKNDACNIDDKDKWKEYATYAGIAIAGIFIIIIIIWGGRKIYYRITTTPEMKAMEAYKKEKFEQLLEMETIRTIYDQEVDNLDNIWHESTAKTIKSGKPTTSSSVVDKRDNVMTTLSIQNKGFKEKIRSDIETNSKNTNFWNDFHANSQKYYADSSSNLVPKKNMKERFKWSKKKVKNGKKDAMNRDELIRTEARLQYEDIKKDNRRRLTDDKAYYAKIKKETAKNMPIVDREKLGKTLRPRKKLEQKEDIDPLLAKTISILNQEQIDIHHEMLRTKRFAKFEKMDQLEKWSKTLKETRTKTRNDRNKEFFGEPVKILDIPVIDDDDLAFDFEPEEEKQLLLLPPPPQQQQQLPPPPQQQQQPPPQQEPWWKPQTQQQPPPPQQQQQQQPAQESWWEPQRQTQPKPKQKPKLKDDIVIIDYEYVYLDHNGNIIKKEEGQKEAIASNNTFSGKKIYKKIQKLIKPDDFEPGVTRIPTPSPPPDLIIEDVTEDFPPPKPNQLQLGWKDELQEDDETKDIYIGDDVERSETTTESANEMVESRNIDQCKQQQSSSQSNNESTTTERIRKSLKQIVLSTATELSPGDQQYINFDEKFIG